MHLANGMDCIAALIPALIEKPAADDVLTAQTLVEASERAGVPLLTVHHRRHNPMIQRAKAEIDSGRLGQIVSVHGMFWLIKPDDYFDASSRREKQRGLFS
jgi:predicted dehydrogenase